MYLNDDDWLGMMAAAYDEAEAERYQQDEEYYEEQSRDLWVEDED